MTNDSSRSQAAAAEASDVEQAHGHGGNLRDAGAGAELPRKRPADIVGSSGDIPRLEETDVKSGETTGSPGADADRQAG